MVEGTRLLAEPQDGEPQGIHLPKTKQHHAEMPTAYLISARGELYQVAGDKPAQMITKQGMVIADDENCCAPTHVDQHCRRTSASWRSRSTSVRSAFPRGSSTLVALPRMVISS